MHATASPLASASPSKTASRSLQAPEARDRILRWPEVRDRVPVNGSTVWRWEQAGKFPRRVKLGPNSVGWYESEVERWMAERRQRG
jgi:prophage regulatory protein